MSQFSEQVLPLFEENRSQFLERARAAATDLWWSRQEPLTIDDIREVCPPPESMDPRVMGAVFAGWQKVGYTNSRRRECHGRPIAQFIPGEASRG